jgi:hypothetical protein
MKRPCKQTLSLDERLLQQAVKIKREAEALPPGSEREGLLKQAQHADTAARINSWLTSPGLQPPK